MLGTVVYDVTPGPHGSRQPADLAIPIGSYPEGISSPYLPRVPATSGEENTVHGGVWRSGEPVTLEDPRELDQLWRDKVNGTLYLAASTAMGTRYVLEPIDSIARALPNDYSRRIVIGRREFRERMERVG